MTADPDRLVAFVMTRTTTSVFDTLDTKRPAVDMIFCTVQDVEPKEALLFKTMLAQLAEESGVSLLDGGEHSFIEVGDLLGGRYATAIRLMALGALWGLWRVLTPMNQVPGMPRENALALAKSGLVTVMKV